MEPVDKITVSRRDLLHIHALATAGLSLMISRGDFPEEELDETAITLCNFYNLVKGSSDDRGTDSTN